MTAKILPFAQRQRPLLMSFREVEDAVAELRRLGREHHGNSEHYLQSNISLADDDNEWRRPCDGEVPFWDGAA